MNGRFERMSGMSGLLRMALVGVMTLVFGLTWFATSAEAVVAVVNQFSTTPCDTDATAAPTSSLICTTPTIGAGADRVLVLVVTGEAGGNHNPASTTATYGTASFTTIMNSDGNNDNRRYVWMGYINESQITANAGANIAATLTSNVNWVVTQAQYAVYSGVNQTGGTSTIPGAAEAGSAGTSTALSMGPITSVAGGAAIYAISANATTGNTTVPTNYTEHVDQVNTGAANYFVTIGSRVTTPGTTESITATTVNNRWLAAFATLGVAPVATNGTIALSAATYSVSEAGPTVTITATRTGGSTGIVGISYATSNGTATAGSDYTATSNTLSWAAGDTANKTFTVPVTNDTLDEVNETFTVTLSAPTGGATLGAPASATVTITDNDAAPTVGFSAATSSGNEATTPAVIPVTLSTASGQTITVNYTTANGTATQPGDYTTTSGTLTFTAGTTTQNISVPIINDTTPEANETFTVTLSVPVNATLGTTGHTYTINNDDLAGSIQLSSATYAVGEAGPTVTITATRTGGSAGAVGITYATSNGTATAGSDYTATTNTLSWAAGDAANKTFTVTILENATPEPSETFNVTLSAPTGFATLGAPSSAVVTITDNDNASPTLSVSEPNGTGDTVTVGASYNVTYTLADSDNVVTAAFYYDTNTDMTGGIAISGACAAAAEGTNATCSWNTTGVPAGLYYVYGITNDGVNPAVSAVSPGQITIASNATAAGSASALAGNTVINVSAPYTGDTNGNNTLLIEWGLNGVSYALGSSVRPHAVSPYAYTITGLTNGTAYQVRVTYQDSDTVTGTAVQTFTNITPVVWTDSALLHNSNRFAGTTQHGGAWGIPGQYAGGITCDTCHAKGATNIKRIKSIISFPDGSTMPNSAINTAVSFSSVIDGSSDFGNDAGGHATSNKICEVCHSTTAYHNWNTAGNTGGTSHENQTDCVKCHTHSTGFKASCTSCHGGGSGNNYWPDASTAAAANDVPGRHLVHMEQLAQKVYAQTTAQLLADPAAHTKQIDLCGYCHATPGADVDHSVPGAAETAFANIWNKAADADGAYVADSCSNINCHNNVATGATTYGWTDAGTTACLMCHTLGGANDVDTANPASGLHNVTPSVSAERHDDAFGSGGSCTSCHSGPLTAHRDGVAQGGNGQKIQMGLPAFYTQTADNTGTCATTACHITLSDDWAHKWDSSGTIYTNASASCAGCHGDWANTWNTGVIHRSSAGTLSTHGGTGTYKCVDCHALGTAGYPFTFSTADWAPLNAGNKHGNGSIDVNNNGVTYNTTSNLCTTCHTVSDGTHNFVDTSWPIAGVAGNPIVVACGSCHTAGVTTTAASGAHVTHLANTTDLVAGGANCVPCHGNNGGLNFQSTLAGTHGSGSVTFASVTYSQAATRGNLTGTCLTSACHNVSTGTDQSTAWNTTALACDDCHYYNAAPTSAGNLAHGRPLSTTHNDHFTGGKTCTQCHGAMPAAGNTAHITGTALADRAVAVVADNAAVAWTDASAVTDYTFENTGNTCYSATNNGLGCHATAGAAGAADATRPDWDVAFASTACTNCHTNTTTTAVNPNSGLHNVTPSISGVRHDGSIAGGCAVCHNTIPVAGTHKNGTFTGDTVANLGLRYYSQTVANSGVGTCATTTCHLSFSDDWAHQWTNTAGFYTSATVSCAGCHGDALNTWNAGVIHRTNAAVTTTHGGAGTYKCLDCHVLGNAAYPFTFGTADWAPLNAGNKHGNAQIEVNSNGATYNATTGICATCHTATGADGIHNFLDTSWPIANLSGGAISISCTSCHTGSGGGALNVGSTSSHVTRGNKAGFNTFVGCDDCHPMHSGGVLVPNNATVGINYTADARTGFRLGGSATTGTTEAEICWNCHNNMTYQTTAISEWGVNSQAATGSSPYNYGTLTTPNWTTATWSSSRTQFAYKTGAIQSTHTANPAVTDAALGGANYSRTETKNAVAEIRCSYCHDVHERALATGDTAAGKPYLRGNWRGNPYEEDGAPRSVYANTTYFTNYAFTRDTAGVAVTRTYGWGAVPRGSTRQAKIGGYWIDQNNVVPMSASAANGTPALNPTATWTVDQFAGLCALCHGGGNASWTTTEVDNIDQRTGEALWMGTNGHANSVKGGTGSASANDFNVFNARTGVTTYGQVPRQHYNGMSDPGDNGSFGFRATEGLNYAPLFSSARAYGWRHDDWIVDETGATLENQYHKFSCSKCHNPHASRLPKLMITNCLDTVHNTWDNQFQLNPQAGNNQNKELAQWTSAQNCHRYSESNNTTTTVPEYRASRTAGAAGTGPGWNKVTPWKQTLNVP